MKKPKMLTPGLKKLKCGEGGTLEVYDEGSGICCVLKPGDMFVVIKLLRHCLESY